MLQIKNVQFAWPGGDRLTYDLTIEAGAIIALHGASGVGKSTLLELIAGFETPDRGEILWQDRRLNDLSPWDRPVTTVFQSDNLFAHLTCIENILIAIGADKNTAPDTLSAVHASFDQLGLTGLQDRLPGHISGGQQQRVALVRAMMRQKPILLLDESFSALDWELRTECFDALQTVVETHNMAAILVSHDLRDADYLGCATHRLS